MSQRIHQAVHSEVTTKFSPFAQLSPPVDPRYSELSAALPGTSDIATVKKIEFDSFMPLTDSSWHEAPATLSPSVVASAADVLPLSLANASGTNLGLVSFDPALPLHDGLDILAQYNYTDDLPDSTLLYSLLQHDLYETTFGTSVCVASHFPFSEDISSTGFEEFLSAVHRSPPTNADNTLTSDIPAPRNLENRDLVSCKIPSTTRPNDLNDGVPPFSPLKAQAAMDEFMASFINSTPGLHSEVAIDLSHHCTDDAPLPVLDPSSLMGTYGDPSDAQDRVHPVSEGTANPGNLTISLSTVFTGEVAAHVAESAHAPTRRCLSVPDSGPEESKIPHVPPSGTASVTTSDLDDHQRGDSASSRMSVPNGKKEDEAIGEESQCVGALASDIEGHMPKNPHSPISNVLQEELLQELRENPDAFLPPSNLSELLAAREAKCRKRTEKDLSESARKGKRKVRTEELAAEYPDREVSRGPVKRRRGQSAEVQNSSATSDRVLLAPVPSVKSGASYTRQKDIVNDNVYGGDLRPALTEGRPGLDTSSPGSPQDDERNRLVSHTSTGDGSGKRPTRARLLYPCRYPTCDKAYTDLSTCNRHLERHFEVKRFQCSGCGRFAVRRDSVHKTHVQGNSCPRTLSKNPEILVIQQQPEWKKPENLALLKPQTVLRCVENLKPEA